MAPKLPGALGCPYPLGVVENRAAQRALRFLATGGGRAQQGLAEPVAPGQRYVQPRATGTGEHLGRERERRLPPRDPVEYRVARLLGRLDAFPLCGDLVHIVDV